MSAQEIHCNFLHSSRVALENWNRILYITSNIKVKNHVQKIQEINWNSYKTPDVKIKLLKNQNKNFSNSATFRTSHHSGSTHSELPTASILFKVFCDFFLRLGTDGSVSKMLTFQVFGPAELA